MGVKRSIKMHLSSYNWFGPLFSSQNWTNFENIPKISNFLMDFDNFCSFFECHSILAEKQRTKQTNYSSLSLSPSLDTQDTFHSGIIVEWNKFWQEIPVWAGTRVNSGIGQIIVTFIWHQIGTRNIRNIYCDMTFLPWTFTIIYHSFLLVSNVNVWEGTVI